jgi:hypothetical protein
MGNDNVKTSRRHFVLNGGVTLGAGVAVAGSAMALPTSPRPLADSGSAQDREAIRSLHAQFIAAVESAMIGGAQATHKAYRSNALQAADQLVLESDTATASWNVDVQVATPLDGDSTAAQMARLQGMFGDVRWEAGRLEACYEKTRGQWRMTELTYVTG